MCLGRVGVNLLQRVNLFWCPCSVLKRKALILKLKFAHHVLGWERNILSPVRILFPKMLMGICFSVIKLIESRNRCSSFDVMERTGILKRMNAIEIL